MMSRLAHGIALNRRLALRRLGASIASGELPFTRCRGRCKMPARCYCATEPPILTTYEKPVNVPIEHFDLLPIYNEPLLQYEVGSPERTELEEELQKIMNNIERVPIVINGEEIHAKRRYKQLVPYNLEQTIASYGHASREQLEHAIDRIVEIQEGWDATKLSDRMTIWATAADLIATKYRYKIIAAIMLGQGKTVRQAELDVAELVDFIRINPVFLRDLANYEPVNDRPTAYRNNMRLRGLTGFVAAISPFNYTSIAGNLAFTPALMGNTVLWKPSDSAILSNWYVFKAMQEAGLPNGVVNFVPTEDTSFAAVVTESSKLAAINFTGTSGVLKVLWQLVANNINLYENYPRLVGECGGKNFHFVHSSADTDTVVACTIRAAFEYAGQKCSSCSMLYVPESLWETQIKRPLLNVAQRLFVSDATYCDCFYSAVINKRAYNRIYMYLQYIHNNNNCNVLLGGTCSKSLGYYVEPTIVELTDLNDRLCKEELLAPILCVHVYRDEDIEHVMKKVAQVNHGLTGSVFASDNDFIKQACEAFKLNVGNLNINDKSTGSMVGQQPFGAGHLTGTNEKVGSPHYLLRWTSPQVVKESFVPHVNIYYPYMEISDSIVKLGKTPKIATEAEITEAETASPLETCD